MSKKLRVLSAILLLLTILSGLLACVSTSDPPPSDTTQQETEVETQQGTNLPPVDYNGKAFRVVCYDPNENAQFPYSEIESEESSSNLLEDAIYRRNLAVREKYNITYEAIHVTRNPWEEAQRSYLSGGDDYDLIMPNINGGMLMAQNGLSVSAEEIPHVNTDASWWISGINQDISFTVEYISLHTYFNRHDGDSASFLASNADMELHIKDSVATCDYVKAKYRSKKTMYLSFDEYNVWNNTKDVFEPWSEAPHRLEAIYTLEDAVSLGAQLITLIRHSDRVKVACLAQLVNVIAPILTENGGSVIKQAIYYPFLHASRYGRGSVLHTRLDSPMYECRRYGAVPIVEAIGVYDDTGTVTVFACNRSLEEAMPLRIELQSFGRMLPKEHIVLTGRKGDANSFASPNTVVPHSVSDLIYEDGQFHSVLPPLSWNVLRFSPLNGEEA